MKRNRISGNAGVGCGAFKNAAILFTIILISVGCADSSAQSTNQDGSRLVGTWVEVKGGVGADDDKGVVRDGGIWVFNSDGTGSNQTGGHNYSFKYATIAGIVKMRGCEVGNHGHCGNPWSNGGTFVISNDGKTLFLDVHDGGGWLSKSSGK